MTLTVDYTLYNSASGETINLTNQTATVPAAYMSWKPNFAYTYLFKITDDKLTPITLDAVIIDTDDGKQETITTITEPSITTYAKASNVTVNNEYLTSSNIYAIVADGTPLVAATAKLYTATIEAGALQGITETTVANAIAHGTQNPTGTWTVTDANGKKLTVVSSNGLSFVSEIAADDAPYGAAISINAAKFTPASAGTYVFEYTAKFVQATGTYVSGTTYYTDATGATTVDTTGFVEGVTDVSSYFISAGASPAKYYKVIKVVAPTP